MSLTFFCLVVLAVIVGNFLNEVVAALFVKFMQFLDW